MGDRLDNSKVASRYARALFDATVASGDMEAVAVDLQAIGELLPQLPELSQFMENPGIPASDKTQFVESQLARAASPQGAPWIKRILALLVENNRMPVLPHLIGWFQDFRNQRENIARGEIVTAVELEDELRHRIQQALEQQLGYSRVELQNRVDPGILGGAIIKVQDQIIDGSYVGRLETLRKQLGAV